MSKKAILGFCSVIICFVFYFLFTRNALNPVSQLSQNREVKLTVLATADLHGNFPAQLAQFIQECRKKDKNLILVDAGDFIGSEDNPLMKQWFSLYVRNPNHTQRRMSPIVREWGKWL